jgi:hypothetical protein
MMARTLAMMCVRNQLTKRQFSMGRWLTLGP